MNNNILTYKSGILYFTIYNKTNGILGIALVKKGFEAELHSHKEKETYIFMEGTGKLHLDNKEINISKPSIITIDSNKVHAMTPISKYVKLMFIFNQGPLNRIDYNYYNKFINL